MTVESEFFKMLVDLKTRGNEFAILLGNQPARAKIQFMSGDYVMFRMLDMDRNPVVAMHWTHVVIIGVESE
ncbi:hypothetical protein [Rheinheimera pacifica]|uniref:hypothetical protein n=1 Tax=Rheinheimera pacifica TaxID=173990 RepID=UPI002EDABFBC